MQLILGEFRLILLDRITYHFSPIYFIFNYLFNDVIRWKMQLVLFVWHKMVDIYLLIQSLQFEWTRLDIAQCSSGSIWTATIRWHAQNCFKITQNEGMMKETCARIPSKHFWVISNFVISISHWLCTGIEFGTVPNRSGHYFFYMTLMSATIKSWVTF